ncbi:SpoIIE family protein phosphatase [Streptomyces sp. AV19]|uniref:SpoIIE family protein phosphatase n=1 Tax=Streptomyces sp. AV19 TaxID=2793068 RepID=UPI0024136374|nr:SpoIIE family protein phosphatase [Streptomyces sp. AV19]MDG4533809.1 SpoIIE family protein phosphatase [Streptomyces sp. AV19]
MASESVRDDESGVAPDVVQLAKVVAKLRAENERLEHLASTAAVLERAKGVLMARSGCSAPAAYQELTRRASSGGRTLMEECWRALGGMGRDHAVTEAAGDVPEEDPARGHGSVFDSARYVRRTVPGPRGPETTGAAVLRELGEGLAGVTDAQELAGRLLDHLAGPPAEADAVMLFVRNADGTLELGGHAGVGATLAAQWRHVPPVAGIAALDVIRSGEAIWLEDLEQDGGRHHLPADAPHRWPTRAWLPVVTDGTTTAALGVLRTVDAPFGPDVRGLLEEAAGLCAGSLRACGAPPRQSADRTARLVQPVLDALPGAAVLLTPMRSATGEVEDFRIDAAAPRSVDVAGRRGHQLVGLRVLECYPTLAGTPAWQGYLDTLRTGRPYACAPCPYEEVAPGVRRISTFSVRATRLGDALVVTWTCHDGARRQRELLGDVQRLGNLGWADWNLVTDTITWSQQVYAILDRDPARGPMTLEELPRHLLPEDLPAFGRAIRGLLGAGTPVDHPFRITTRSGVRHLRVVAEAVLDAQDEPVEVHGFVQDITAQRLAELALMETQQAVLAQRTVLQAERTVAARLQQALLPLPGQSLNLADLRVDVAYLPSHDDLNVGGDWYSALELPDGSVLFAIGDVAGHGIGAVAAMAQLRFTAKGMVFTGSELTDALRRLNALLLHAPEGNHTTATMVLGRYDPTARRLAWAQAGHLPPLLVRRGTAEFLTPPGGVLLGAVAEPSYGRAECRLEPGDHLLLYTDGLVERPRELLDEGLARLAGAARSELGGPGPGSLDALLARLLPKEQRDDVCLLDMHLPRRPAAPPPPV